MNKFQGTLGEMKGTWKCCGVGMYVSSGGEGGNSITGVRNRCCGGGSSSYFRRVGRVTPVSVGTYGKGRLLVALAILSA